MNTKTVKDLKVILIYLCIIISQIIYLKKKTLYKLGDDERKFRMQGSCIYLDFALS